MCRKHYFGLSITDLLGLAFQFAKKVRAPVPNSWANNSMAGRHWYRGFMRRHPTLSLRTPEQTSLSRVKAFYKDVNSHCSLSMSNLLIEIGPVQPGPPKPISNRERKPGRSTILTSSPNMIQLKTTAQKRREAEAKPTPTRETVQSSSSSGDDKDFCIICLQTMPKMTNSNNSIACNTCERVVHLKCAEMTTGFFTCKHCDSEHEEEEDE